MDGLKINGVSLFLGKMPTRKQECFYFEEGVNTYPIAYILPHNLKEGKRLWAKFAGVPKKDGKEK